MPDRVTEESLPPEELAARYLARHDWSQQRQPEPEPETWALSIWEDRIVSDPERAWPFFLELVRRRPDDDDVLEQVWNRLRLLLRYHGGAFHSRVVALVNGNARLRRIAPAPDLEPGALRPKPLDVPALVEAYLTNAVHAEEAYELDRMIRDDPDHALPLALEIISRGPLHGFTSYDAFSPLHELLLKHGHAVIDRVEAAAAESVLVRRCLWRMRHHQSHPPVWYDVPPDVWARAERAIDGTTDYNTDDPPGAAHSLPPEYERVVASWFTHEATFWAWERVHDIVENDPELGWRVVTLLVQSAPSDEVLECIAAGPLEDLLRVHGAQFVDRVEEIARRDERFRQCLAGVWLSRGDVPLDVEQRLVEASGGQIFVGDPVPDEDEWLRQQREAVEEYLSRTGLEHGAVAEEPAWSAELLVALWAVQNGKSRAIGWWVIAGDVPTDHVSVRDAADARAALRVFSNRWAEATDFMAPGEDPDAQHAPEELRELARFLRAHAEILSEIDDDRADLNDGPPEDR